MSTQNTEIFTKSVKPVIESQMSHVLMTGFKFFLLVFGVVVVVKIIEIALKRRK